MTKKEKKFMIVKIGGNLNEKQVGSIRDGLKRLEVLLGMNIAFIPDSPQLQIFTNNHDIYKLEDAKNEGPLS